jgi:hypothetical protein
MTDEVRARVESELAKISTPTLLVTNPDAVIYYGLPSIISNSNTDVMVLVPGGYPQSMLDLAFLPAGSPLLGVLKGQPQQDLMAGGKAWTQVSYHPHGNGGAPPWDPTRHGFHTYIDEVLSWISVRR